MAKRKAKSKTHQDADDAWEGKVDFVRTFLDLNPLYTKLASEVAYALERALTKQGIEFSAVTYRPKTLDSVLEKIDRKEYEDPLHEITDLAGVRIVHLYVSDFEQIQQVIESQFEIVETIDNLAEQGTHRRLSDFQTPD